MRLEQSPSSAKLPTRLDQANWVLASHTGTTPCKRMRRLNPREERGVMIVLVAIILPLLLLTAAAVWDVGNWWTHRRHLQTKADAAALAGGAAWGFPCATDSDARIVAEARKYVGPHMGPAGQDFTAGTTYTTRRSAGLPAAGSTSS